MKVLIIAIGSRGDVNPYLAVGRALQSRGHEIVFCAAEYFKDMVESLGFSFRSHSTHAQYFEQIANPALWSHFRAVPTFFSTVVMPYQERIYALIERERTGDFLVIASPFAFAARVAEEVRGIKLAQLHLAPAQFRTLQDTSQIGVLPMGRRMPGWYKRCVWWCLDRFLLDPYIIGSLNAFRGKLGCAPVRRALNDWWFSRRCNAAVFSPCFAERRTGWPEPCEVFDFICFDGQEELTPEAERFLEHGSRPVVFTPGTAFRFGKSFFAESLTAVQKLGLRGIFLTHNRDDIPGTLPETVYACTYLPLGKLLSRCAAIVHHGGIGTLAQAARAGIPQIVRPMAFDQFDNASRLQEKNLGVWISVNRYRGSTLARLLDHVLHDRRVQAGCSAISKKIDSQRALGALAERLETL